MYGKTISPLKLLIAFSTLYLLLPNLLFFYYWFRFPYQIVLTASCLLFGILYFRKLEVLKDSNTFSINKNLILVFILIGTSWTLVSGVGGLFYQVQDFQGHNVKLLNLVNASWPLKYEYNGEEVIYYFGYYLVPAFLMKLFGGYSAAIFVAWSAIGYSLAFAWIYVLFYGNWKKILAFLFMAETGVFFNAFIFQKIGDFPQHEWPLFFGSIFQQSTWVPNQFLPIMLTTPLIIYLFRSENPLNLAILPIVLSLIWCVFPIVAIAIVFLLALIIYRKYNIILKLTIESLPYLILVAPLLIYYQSSNGGGVAEFFLVTANRLGRFPVWAGQIIPQLTVFLILTFAFIPKSKERVLSLALIGLMLSFSLLRVGVFNDLVSRTFIVFFIVELYLIVSHFTSESIVAKPYILIILFIDIYISFFTLYKKTTNNAWVQRDPAYKIYPYNESETIFEYFKNHGSTPQEIIQYSSKEKSIYQDYLAK